MNRKAKVIYFLSKLPNKYLLFIIFLFVFAAYLYYRTDFLAQLAEKAFLAAVALIGAQKAQQTYTADRINPPRSAEKTEKTAPT